MVFRSLISCGIFSKILNMSLTASAVILFVILARLALKKAPKVFSYALWLAVLFRLLCPFSVTSAFSLLGLFDPPVRKMTPVTSTVEYIPSAAVPADNPQTTSPAPAPSQPIRPAAPQGEASVNTDADGSFELLAAAFTGIWAAGVLIMLLYSVLSFVRLRRRLIGATPLRGNIYLADHISTPFVMGLFCPKIYLPSALPESEYRYVILHEKYHIHRLDHVVRVLAYAALCLHWFNPLVCLAFFLSGKDMEMSCDEAVLKRLGEGVRADYSESLLRLATGRRIPAGMPLAFGEGDTRSRIKNLLSWKKPKLWISLAAAAACIAVIAACAANPQAGSEQPEDDTPVSSDLIGQYTSMEDYAAYIAQSIESVTYSPFPSTTPGETVTAAVTNVRVAWLDQTGTLEGLALEGTLESWIYNYEVQIDVAPGDIMLAGGMYEQDGWYDLEGQGGHNVVALRYEDGSYDILYDQIINDDLDFYGYHNSYEETLYDWYVIHNNLDLPLYVTTLNTSDGQSEIAHRYDGYGWYIYIPVSGWEFIEPWTQWNAQTGSERHLSVEVYNDQAKDIMAYWASLGAWRYDTGMDSPFDFYYLITPGAEAHEEHYFISETEKSSFGVKCYWARNSVQAGEAELLRAMASSFRVDKRIRLDEATEQLRTALREFSDVERFTREDGRNRRELTLSPSFHGLVASLADRVQGTADPDGIPVRPVTVYLYDRQLSHLAFTAAEEFGRVLIRYVNNAGVNAAAVVDDPELYVYLLAVEEDVGTELHDLDGDGSLESLVWTSTGNRYHLVIYDTIESELSRINVSEVLNATGSNYTGLIANIEREYGNMVEVFSADGSVGVYRYMPDGTFTYVISLDDALRKYDL